MKHTKYEVSTTQHAIQEGC